MWNSTLANWNTIHKVHINSIISDYATKYGINRSPRRKSVLWFARMHQHSSVRGFGISLMRPTSKIHLTYFYSNHCSLWYSIWHVHTCVATCVKVICIMLISWFIWSQLDRCMHSVPGKRQNLAWFLVHGGFWSFILSRSRGLKMYGSIDFTYKS